MRKNLLITTDCFLPRWDGVARFLSEVIPKLREHFNVTVVAPDFPGDFAGWQSVEIVRLPLWRVKFGDILFSRYSPRLVRNLVAQSDIVFNQTIGPIGIAAVRAAYKLKRKVVSYVHSVEWELASKGVRRGNAAAYYGVKFMACHVYNKCSLLVLPSQYLLNVMECNGVRVKKVVIPLGVDTEKFAGAEYKAEFKRQLGIGKDEFVVGFVGRVAREKDLPTLVKAFERLYNKFHNVRLLVVGEGVDVPELKHESIMLVGRQDNVVPFFHAMDVYVLPSLTETNSLSTMEAMSCNLPVVVTKVGSLMMYIQDGVNGLFFSRGDVDELYKKLELLYMDKELRIRLGRSARETIRESYRSSVAVERIRDVLLHL